MALKGKTALLLDDDPSLHALAGRILRNVGMDVFFARTVPEALTIARTRHPHIIFADLHLADEGGSGFDFLKELNAEVELGGIPVVMLTSDSAPESTLRCQALGARDILSKPLEARLLLRAVRKHLIEPEWRPLAPAADANLELVITVPAVVVAGSGDGLEVESSLRLAAEARVQLLCPVCEKAGFTQPPLVKLNGRSVRAEGSPGFRNGLQFLYLSPEQEKRLREVIARWHTR